MTDPASQKDRLAGLSREQRAILFEQIRKRKEKERAAAPPAGIPRRPADLAPLPLSFAQERLWFIDRLQPGLAAYNIPQALLVRGEASPAVLAALLGEIVRRHEVLRTTFREVDGRPVQVIAPVGSWSLPLVDLSALPAAVRGAQSQRLAQEEADRPFDLAVGPLLRATLLRLAPDEHALLLDMHHIVSDGWSMGVLVREISALFAAARSGAPSPLPELPVQYADFAVWQRGWLRGETLERQLAYWRQKLAALPATLDLPTDRPLPSERTYAGGRLQIPFTPGFERELAAFARRHEATPFMVLLAGFQALLSRMTGQEDLAVGSPIANRNRAEIEPLIGFFVNTLVLRGDLAGEPSFAELVARVRRTTLEAYAHQDLPFEQLVEELRPERHLAVNPLFQVLFAVQNAPMGAMELPGLTLEPLPFETLTAQFDLELSLWDFGAGLVADIAYSTELFDAPTPRRLASHLEHLLRVAMEDPGRPVAEAQLLRSAEAQQLLREWNDTARRAADPLLAEEMVWRQAELAPGAIAVEDGDELLTYGELVERARRLAAVLIAAGVGPDVPVGLWVGRSLALPVSVLAVLAAGGACLPLDPSYPVERLAWTLADARPRLVLAASETLAELPPGLLDGYAVVAVDRKGEAASGSAAQDVPPNAPSPENIAYILYTSGSTGRPKGVAQTHRMLGNLAAWNREVRARSGARVLQFSPLGFDVAFEELFSTWASGGTLVLMPDELRRDPAALLSLLVEKRIERLFQPFVALQQLAEVAREPGRPPVPLREVVTAGEQLRVTPALAALCGRGALLYNEYGPTETHVVTAFRLAGSSALWPSLPPIGRPIANHRMLVLDRLRQPVPLGVPGELCIGGAGLARGYLGRPELTAERFIPDPEGVGGRLYRSGDLARWTAQGELEFLGRTDFQIKVRGYRVEPGEVEAALNALPRVQDAAVVARQDPPGGLRLVAYLVWSVEGSTKEGKEERESELREALKALLPAAMIPAAFVGLAALPLTASGKVDRRALAGPAFAPQGGAVAAGYVAPATGTERQLAAIWSEVLGVKKVGARDDFFDLGGHSLLAVQILSRMRDRLGVDLPVRVLFEAPTLAALAQRVDAARPRTAAPDAPVPGQPGVPATPARRAQDRAPLSFAQTRLWFLDRLEPGSTTYNLPFALRMEGELSPAVLAAVLGEVVRRHEVLRTVFAEREGEPEQVIAPPSRRWDLPLADLAALPAEAGWAESLRLAAAGAARPFDLARGPLFRATLLRLGAAGHVLLLEIHHVVADGWSVGVLIREITALYGAAVAGLPSPLPELPLQYADFAVWQRGWLQGEELERQLAYWRQALAGAPATLDLPADRPLPALRSEAGARVSVAFASALREELAPFARRHEATPFMVLLAAFQALLCRLTGQEDLTVGSPVAGRSRAESEPLIGFFVNTLVMRGDLAGDPSFGELLARVRQTTLDAFAHQDLPFEQLVEELRPERQLAVHPLFQVLFAVQNAPLGTMELPGLTLSPLPFATRVAQFDLDLSFWDSADGLVADVGYRTDLFDPPTPRRLVRQLEVLLGAVLADPSLRLSAAPILTVEERQQLLVEWNPAPVAAAPAQLLHRRFEAQAARTPGAIALAVGEERLTYAGLDRLANRLAHHLQAAGVRPGDRVALRLERSAEMIAAILAVLKAGAAYVPLDPSHPAERLAETLADSGAALLITDGATEAGVRTVRLDSERREINRRSGERLAGPELDAAFPAYVIYTSGSTGRPKGVVVSHASVDRLFTAAEPWFGFGADDVWSCFHSYAFDFSVWEIWGALFHGGRLVIVPYWESRSPDDFYRLLRREGVTVLSQTPAAFAQLLAAEEAALADAEPELALRWVIFGGEALEPARLAPWFARHGDQRPGLVNMYGITETTVHVTWRRLRGEDALAGGPSAIGQPLSDLVVHLLDRHLQPSPIGVPGEIHVGGAGLAQGYLGSPELTAERFVPDPFPARPGERLYRSGDRARRLASGDIEYLGRTDQQVKIRGFRIEAGEIEAALTALAEVREAVVVARGDGPRGEPRLVAYVVPAAGARAEPASLRPSLAARLPDYMLPAAFVILDALPLTENGKVDRRALPAPAAAGSGATGGGAPRTELEQFLAAQFRAILELPADAAIGVDEDFFALGGHSLLATQLVARLRESYAVELPLRAIFEAPRVSALASAIETLLGPAAGELLATGAAGRPAASSSSRFLPLVRRPAGEPAPLSFGQERLWFLDRMEPGNPAFNMGSSLRLGGPLRPWALERAVNEIVRRHQALRATFGEVEGRPVQRALSHLWVPLVGIDLSALPAAVREAEAGRVARDSLGAPFDLASGPLIRTSLLHLAADLHVFVLDVHHIVTDGWSAGVMDRELITLYDAFLTGRPSPLPALPIQYGDFASWQRQWLAGETLETQLAYWRRQLGGELRPLDLPTDHPRPAVQSFRGGSIRLALPAATGGALGRLARQRRASLFMTLLAAFKALLSRLAGQEDVVVGTPVAGRRHPETEKLIGFFLNTLALRTDLGGDPAFHELLDRVRETTLGAYEHQDVPFEALLAELKPERDLSRTPLFQVFFNMLNLPPQKVRVTDLEVDWGPAPEPESKFDLTLYVSEADDEILVNLVYNADLFDPPRMQELLRQYRLVLEQVVEDPGRRIRGLSLRTATAAAVLPDPARPLDAAWRGAVHELFLETARRQPERPAVSDPQASWSYGELAAAVELLAAHLCAAGLERGERVAVWAHRSAPLAWAVLGTLAAGGAFVMLDPAYPPARLAEILRLSAPRAWLAVAAAGAPPREVEELLAGWEAEGRLLSRVVLPGGGPAAAGQALPPPAAETPRPRVETGPGDLAFVAFTSGSTGRPKGIRGLHGPLSYFLPWQRERFGLGPEDRYSLLSGLAHDPLQRDLFTALCTGATLCAPDPEEIFVPGRLAAWAARQGITVAHLTPAMGQVLTEPAGLPEDAGEPAAIPTLRYVLLVGDVLTRLDVDRIRRLAPAVTCVNLYGSTETQRAVSFHVVDPAAGAAGLPGREVLPLGCGMDGVQLLVVNADERLAGIGEIGEIWMRSPHLAGGYLGDEALTAERFRINPFTGSEGDRVYRTGDLGRYLPDGEAVFAGRADDQVKIRGFRIEPGEIQATIGRLPGVRESVVVVREEAGERFLAAYVVPEPGAEPGIAGRLRPFLAAQLPDYMVPAAFVELPALPLTPNGKVDRRALPAPRRESAASGAAGVAPRTPTEEKLAEVWADLLHVGDVGGVSGIGVHDNFFELGGHSLLATQLVSRVRRAFAVELPLRVVFEAPTIAGLAEWIEPGGLRAAEAAGPPLRPVARDHPLPLSFAQERLWFLHLLAPASPVYNMTAAVRLAGRLDAGALAAALGEILRRHEPLRTTFRTTASGAVQEIHPWAPPRQPLVDLSGLPAERREGETQRIAGEEAARPFDLERGPLFRAVLLRVAADDHVALWGTHHISADGWSLTSVFVPELARLYAAFAHGDPSPLSELPLQYADYALWQREWLRGPVLAEQVAYWRRQLAWVAPIELPADRPRPPAPTGHGRSRFWELPAGRVASLGRLARQGEGTLFMALLAAFSAVLHRQTGQDEVPVGMPVASRSRTEIEGLIGFFVNTLVLRGDLAGDPDFPTLLARSRDTVLGALSHQDLPFERLVDELGLPRNPYRPPLLRVVFQLQTVPAEGRLELPGLALIPFAANVEAAKFDLTVNLFKVEEELGGAFHYDTDLFDDPTVARLAAQFTTLLDAWIDAPGRRLSEVSLLAPAERHQLLVEWNGEAAPATGAVCLHRRFEAAVDRAPEGVALSFPGEPAERLTYGELDGRANRLARHLRTAGVRPGDRVALALERSPEMVVALLAVLKAGGAYVPLDPASPADRLAFILADSGASLLVTTGEAAGEWSTGGLPVIRLDAEREAIAGRSGERLPDLGTPDMAELPAYVIYTSGSTGRPKGVIVSHANVDRLFTATEPWFGFGADDVWTLFHSYAFDFSVWEIWGALLHGGRLVVVPYWESRSPESFYRLLAAERVTVLNQTPSAFRQLLWAEQAALGEAAPDLALRWVIFGGEALEPASLAPWFARHGDERPRLINMYGITETTVHVTFRPVRAADLAGTSTGVSAISAIGQPIPDLAVHLLDRHLQPQPIGVPGEIHVGGAGLAQGYLGRADLTAERFVPDPFAARPGERLYRSGDLARRLPDGDLEYLGRGDQQVKIRGFRIEPAEIEAALAALPGVREAVVVAREDGAGGERRLVAYLVGVVGEETAAAGLRAALAARLPDYMLPSAFVFLAALPLTENGKVDRRALPAPDAAGVAGGKERRTPRDPLETILLDQFRAVLSLPEDRETGIDEDFFELGGTSITSAIFVHRLQEALGEEIHVVAIFDHPTVASLAGHLREHHAEAARRLAAGESAAAGAGTPPERRVLAPLQTGAPGRRPFFFVHSVGGEVVAYRDLVRLLGSDEPAFGLQSPDPPIEDIAGMAALYVATLRAVQPEGPYRIAGWSMGGIVAYEMAVQLEAAGETTEVLAIIDAASPRAWAGEAVRSDTEMLALFSFAMVHLHDVDIPADLAVPDGLGLPPGIELPEVDLSELDIDSALVMALDLGRQVGLLPPSLEPGELRRLFERFRANRGALATYQPRPYYGELHLFRAIDQPMAIDDPGLGWGELVNGGLRIFETPGDHHSILRQEVGELARRLRALMDSVEERS
jgi:amino acid adenylation domain-containing protein